MPDHRCRRTRGAASAVLVLASVLAGLAGTAGAPAEARTPSGAYARQAYDVTNAERAAAGLGRLGRDRCVRRAAVAQAKAMARTEQMFHQDITKLLGACGLGLVGENVAYGYASGRSVVLDGWMQSAPHKANILNPTFTLMGVGARQGHDGRWYVAQVFGRRG